MNHVNNRYPLEVLLRPPVELWSAFTAGTAAVIALAAPWSLMMTPAVAFTAALVLALVAVRRAREEEAAFAHQQARRAIEQTRLEVAKQVQDAWDAQAEAASRLQVTATSVAEAGEALAIEQLKYEQGVGVTTDLLNAESALLTAEADRLQAQFDLVTARFNLLRASGALSPERAAALVAPDTRSAPEGRP